MASTKPDLVLTRCAAVAGLVAAGACNAPGSTAAPTAAAIERTETLVASGAAPGDVEESLVTVRVPLPFWVGPHPEACDFLSYLRYRDGNGPTSAAAADKILVAQPGILEGAAAFDSVARNTVRQAAQLGKHIEFWALDRRSNCLEDRRGVLGGLAARDVHVAVDYYYRNRVIDGHTFAGYLTNDQLFWLGRVGLEQTVRDEYDLLLAELPDAGVRKRKVLLGGHSLGGVLTGFFAVWDFDGLAFTTDDAGYNQCAGYFALDTTITTSLADLSGMPSSPTIPDFGLGYLQTQADLDAGRMARSLSAPVLINAETMNLLAIAGLAADLDPGGQSDLATYIPSNFNLAATLRFLLSKELANFLSGSPAPAEFRLSNAAVLGALLDDNSEPLAFLQTAVGFFDGGPIADKDFPLPNDLAQDPNLKPLTGLVGTSAKAIPDQANGPLYSWRNYDRIGAPDDPVYKQKNGTPFTNAAREVTDIAELARSLAEHPIDFTEEYFPTKLITDINQAAEPQIALHALHREGLTAHPILNLEGGEGLVIGNNQHPPGTTVIAPGYHHLDVLTAAPTNNDGAPEPLSLSLAQFAAR